jgi:hypothetical protein
LRRVAVGPAIRVTAGLGGAKSPMVIEGLLQRSMALISNVSGRDGATGRARYWQRVFITGPAGAGKTVGIEARRSTGAACHRAYRLECNQPLEPPSDGRSVCLSNHRTPFATSDPPMAASDSPVTPAFAPYPSPNARRPRRRRTPRSTEPEPDHAIQRGPPPDRIRQLRAGSGGSVLFCRAKRLCGP